MTTRLDLRRLPLVVLWVTACGQEPADASQDDAGGGGADDALFVEDLTLTENPANVLSFLANWETDRRATTELHVDCGDDYDHRFTSERLVTRHEVFVMGLWTGADCRVEAVGRTPDGATGQRQGEFRAAPLPSVLPQLSAEPTLGAQRQPGWTLVNLNNHFDNVPLHVALVDELGRLRWYHRSSATGAGQDNDVRTFGDDAVLVGGRGSGVLPALVGWDGTLLWEDDFSMSHDIRPYPDADHFMFIQGGTGDCPQEFPSNRTVIIDWRSGVETWSWNLCQHFDPIADVPDWMHANTQTPLPGEDAFVLSSRNQNALFKIDRQTESIVWIMGFAGRPEDGWNGDFAMDPADRFYYQHDPEVLANGNILLFDNGRDPNRTYSRAIEIAYDTEAMTAEVVWEYRHTPDIFTEVWGDADELPNGNRLITFGVRHADQGTTIVEVDRDGAPVWELVFPAKWGAYRAQRVTDPPLGWVVTD